VFARDNIGNVMLRIQLSCDFVEVVDVRVLSVDPNGEKLEHLSSLNPLLIEFLQSIAFPQNAQFALLETS
jgi:hypothetical protein